MKRRSTLVRILTLLVASVQLAAPALSSVADARLALAGSSRATTHIESSTGPNCAAVHPGDCALCRFVSASRLAESNIPAFIGPAHAIQAPSHAAQAGVYSAATRLPRERAPPLS